jgi:DNA-binding LacI/PurR family transcriptional regulator
MKTPLPTMRDVARRAGVSVSTVSLALRNSPLVSAETQAAVRAAVAELGYRVNPYVAAHMRSRRKPQAGVAAPVLAIVDTQRRRHGWRDNRTSMVRAMLTGAKAQAAARGYETREFWLHEPGTSHARFSAMLRARGIHGILLGPSSDLHLELELTWEWFSVVRLGSAKMAPMLHRVVIDHFDAGMRAAQNIYERGFRRPLFPVRELFSKAHDRRIEGGFQMAWGQRADVEPLPPTGVEGLVDGPMLERWIRKYRPDVIIDNEERHVLDLLKGQGWKVPAEIGVMSLCVAAAGAPTSGCVQNGGAMGTAGVDLLVAMIERNETGVPANPITLSLPTMWNPGQTLRPPQ